MGKMIIVACRADETWRRRLKAFAAAESGHRGRTVHMGDLIREACDAVYGSDFTAPLPAQKSGKRQKGVSNEN